MPKFQALTWDTYQKDRDARRNIERFIENVVMSILDIAKTVLASEKKDVPQTYRDTLRDFSTHLLNGAHADGLADFADLRNIIAHEYLDFRWKRIQAFTEKAGLVFPDVVKKLKEYLNGS